jgi:hypothetical protein
MEIFGSFSQQILHNYTGLLQLYSCSSEVWRGSRKLGMSSKGFSLFIRFISRTRSTCEKHKKKKFFLMKMRIRGWLEYETQRGSGEDKRTFGFSKSRWHETAKRSNFTPWMLNGWEVCLSVGGWVENKDGKINLPHWRPGAGSRLLALLIPQRSIHGPSAPQTSTDSHLRPRRPSECCRVNRKDRAQYFPCHHLHKKTMTRLPRVPHSNLTANRIQI